MSKLIKTIIAAVAAGMLITAAATERETDIEVKIDPETYPNGRFAP